MPRVPGFVAAALVAGAAVLAAVPASATDLDVAYPPIEPAPVYAPPPQGGTYDYMTNGPFHKMVAVRAAPNSFSPVLFKIPSGTIPKLTGRCTRNLDLDSIASRSTWYRMAVLGSRWCEVAGLNSANPGWISGVFIRPF